VLRTAQPEVVAEAQQEIWGQPALVRPRLGQGSFRVLVTDTYERRCAVTGERALPVLEAAHIRRVADGGQHRIDNGLLLRSDLHRLFDRGYVTVGPDYRVRVSRRLKDEFDNGEIYYPLERREIRLPAAEAGRPRREFLEWHADTVFRG
jgi:putative restriction endonuclease